MHETSKLRIDIQHAIANNVYEYSTPYETLIFADESKENLESLRYFKTIKIDVKSNKMNFHITLDEQEIKELTVDDLKQIKSISKKVRYEEIIEQINEHLKSDKQKEIEEQNIEHYTINLLEENDDEEKFIPARKNNIERMKCVKFILDKIFNTNTEIEELDLFLYIDLVYKELTLNQDTLYLLLLLNCYTDAFIISPYYENNDNIKDENIIGIRLFFGIYKGGGF